MNSPANGKHYFLPGLWLYVWKAGDPFPIAPPVANLFEETAREMTRRLERRREEAYAIGYLGQAYQDMARPKDAAQMHKQALAISREISDPVGEAGALGGLGNALLDLHEVPQALTCHRDQLRLAEVTAH